MMSYLDLQQKATRVFIDSDPTLLTFSRLAMVDDGVGGKKQADVPATFNETVALISQSDKVPVASQIEGLLTTVEYILLAEVGTQIKVGDTFLYKGVGFKVDHRHFGPAYEEKFDVVKITGGEPV